MNSAFNEQASTTGELCGLTDEGSGFNSNDSPVQ